MLKFIVLTSSLLAYLPTYGVYRKIALSDCDIIVTSMYPCADNPGYGMSMELKIINDNGDKALDIILDVNEQAMAEFRFTIQVDAYNNDYWQENIYSYDGSLCSYLITYVPRAWAKIREAMVPPLESDCDAAPGHHELFGYRASPSDIDMPAVLFGKFRSITKTFDSEGNLFACHVVEVEVAPKSPY